MLDKSCLFFICYNDNSNENNSASRVDALYKVSRDVICDPENESSDGMQSVYGHGSHHTEWISFCVHL